MSWLIVDDDEREFVFTENPKIINNAWWVELPHGSIEKLIGRKLTLRDGPVEMNSNYYPLVCNKSVEDLSVLFTEWVFRSDYTFSLSMGRWIVRHTGEIIDIKDIYQKYILSLSKSGSKTMLIKMS